MGVKPTSLVQSSARVSQGVGSIDWFSRRFARPIDDFSSVSIGHRLVFLVVRRVLVRLVSVAPSQVKRSATPDQRRKPRTQSSSCCCRENLG